MNDTINIYIKHKGFNYINWKAKHVWWRTAYLWVKHWEEAIHVHLLTHKLGIRKQGKKLNDFFALLVCCNNQSIAFVRTGQMRLSISHDIEDDKWQWQKRTTLNHTLTLAIWTTLGNSVRHDIGITSWYVFNLLLEKPKRDSAVFTGFNFNLTF